jgi:uncharacterized protein (TIGR00255 family)
VLLSMTGYGEAQGSNERLHVAVELRALNNRYLKVLLRATEPYHLLEPEVEKVVRRRIRRGTVQVYLRCERQPRPQDYRINLTALHSYAVQLRPLASEWGLPNLASCLGAMLALPGVVLEPGRDTSFLREDWPLVERVLSEALERLQVMRREEGRAMTQELLRCRNTLMQHLERIRQRIPQVTAAFRDRLYERIRALLAEHDIQLDRNELLREVAIFSERSDITEEVVRLSSHLEQFGALLREEESPGRKLEFLTQEMFREANTIGAKAADVAISREVLEIKGLLEKIRELVQNVE